MSGWPDLWTPTWITLSSSHDLTAAGRASATGPSERFAPGHAGRSRSGRASPGIAITLDMSAGSDAPSRRRESTASMSAAAELVPHCSHRQPPVSSSTSKCPSKPRAANCANTSIMEVSAGYLLGFESGVSAGSLMSRPSPHTPRRNPRGRAAGCCHRTSSSACPRQVLRVGPEGPAGTVQAVAVVAPVPGDVGSDKGAAMTSDPTSASQGGAT